MTKIEHYRATATNCARMSVVMCDERARAALLHLATAWLRLADWAEQITPYGG